jgi:hypothetical protein
MKTKYKAIKTEIDGHVFASKKEAKRYCDLKWLLRARKISELQLHKSFELQQKFRDKRTKKIVRPIVYICDFFYWDKDVEAYVVEDVKGIKTDVYKLKKKLFLKKFGDAYIFREI